MEIFEWIGKFVAVVGGAGTIIIGVSAFFSKLWASWFIEKQKSEYGQLLENYKHELSIQLEKVHSEGERANYKEQIIFERELNTMTRIVSLSYKILDSTFHLSEAIIEGASGEIERLMLQVDEQIHEYEQVTMDEVIYIDERNLDIFRDFSNQYMRVKMYAIEYKFVRVPTKPSDEFRSEMAKLIEMQADLMKNCRSYLSKSTKL